MTGGASGIGLALGLAFAEAGMKVVLAGIETDALSTAVETCAMSDPARAASCGTLPSCRTCVPVAKAATFSTASMAGRTAVLVQFAVVNMSEGLTMQVAPLGIGVTVRCPGFVLTRIRRSGRNRPERYGTDGDAGPGKPAPGLPNCDSQGSMWRISPRRARRNPLGRST